MKFYQKNQLVYLSESIKNLKMNNLWQPLNEVQTITKCTGRTAHAIRCNVDGKNIYVLFVVKLMSVAIHTPTKKVIVKRSQLGVSLERFVALEIKAQYPIVDQYPIWLHGQLVWKEYNLEKTVSEKMRRLVCKRYGYNPDTDFSDIL